MRIIRFFIVATLVSAAAMAVAQTDHTGHAGGMHHAPPKSDQGESKPQLHEPGQGAFAALAEVVQLLEADPTTNWSKVDISGLRAHLIDMDRLVSNTDVTETVLINGIAAQATGDAKTIATLRRMVPAHAAQLAQDDRWAVAASQTGDGVVLRVTSDDPAVVARIKGLGFFGLMASQDHHQAHHLRMATGENAHGH